MVAFNFKPDFVTLIECGIKVQTIRGGLRCGPGDKMQLFTGQRTKQCQRIGEAVCVESFPVMFRDTSFHTGRNQKVLQVSCPDELQKFAEADGFQNWDQCEAFFRDHYEFPFTGFVHRWDPATLQLGKKE